MAAFSDSSFAKDTAFSSNAFDFGAAVAALIDYIVTYRRRRR